MELSPSSEAVSWAATYIFPSILRNNRIQHRIHKSPPLLPIRNQTNVVHTF
jgi:hypothetical protein